MTARRRGAVVAVVLNEILGKSGDWPAQKTP